MASATFRNVDDEALSEFRTEATKRNLNFGEALTEAIRLWLLVKKKKLDIRPLTTDPLWVLISNPVDFGKGSEELSSDIDGTLYGD